MRCANPLCCCESPYLRGGSLHLLELEMFPDFPTEYEDSGFAMRSAPQKFFWLCADCMSVFIPKQWTPTGVILVLRDKGLTGSRVPAQIPDSIIPDSMMIPDSILKPCDRVADINAQPGARV